VGVKTNLVAETVEPYQPSPPHCQPSNIDLCKMLIKSVHLS